MNEPATPVTLCVLLWAAAGRYQELSAYEDSVLALLGDHDAAVLQRVRSGESSEGPHEVHVLRFRSAASLDSYMGDPRRLALQSDRDDAIERTQIIRVDLVDRR